MGNRKAPTPDVPECSTVEHIWSGPIGMATPPVAGRVCDCGRVRWTGAPAQPIASATWWSLKANADPSWQPVEEP